MKTKKMTTATNKGHNLIKANKCHLLRSKGKTYRVGYLKTVAILIDICPV